MSTDLRSGLIRLAYLNPELRADLLPLIEKEAAGPSYKDYVEKKRKKNEKPLAEAAWQSRVKGKGEDEGDKGEKGGGEDEKPKAEKPKAVSVGGESFAPEELADRRHEIYDAAAAMQKSVGGAGKHPEVDKAFNALGGVLDAIKSKGKNGGSGAEFAADLDKAHKALSGAVSKAKAKPKSEKPKASFKKNYRPTMESVMTKHSLTDDDAADVIQFSIDRPKKGKEQSPAELMRRFMEHAKPETKERMKGMNPAEFMKMLRAVLDDEDGGGGGKTASLRAGLIRLAYANPDLRADLLPLIAKHAGDDEEMGDMGDMDMGDMGMGDMDMDAELEAEADPTSHGQNLPEHYYFGKTAEERLENIEKLLTQFAAPGSKGQNKPQSYYGLPPKGKQAAAPKVKGGAHPLTRDSIVYFDLVLEDYNIEEDADNGDEFAKSLMGDNQEMMKLQGKALASLKRMFGTTIMNEGHGSDGALVCKFSVDSWADVSKANDVINRHHTGGDDNMGLDVPYVEARSFRLYPDGVNNVFYSEESQAKGDWNEWLSEHKAYGKRASVKTAAGPDAVGRNWKEKNDGGKHRWVWAGQSGDLAFSVTEYEAPFGMYYKMTVVLNDGTMLQTVGQKLDRADWFKRAAAIYRASQGVMLDFSDMPEKWKRMASVKTAAGSGAANAAFLRQSPLKNKILQSVAKHYNTSVSAMLGELTDPDAEAVYEYIGNDAGLQMQVYRDFKAKGF